VSAKRTNAAAAVAGLFSSPTATGGLAGRDAGRAATQQAAGRPREREQRVRLGVELTDAQIAFLRSLSRPNRTGGQRTLGAKFVAAGVLAAAIELLEHAVIDMHGVSPGDHAEMATRARDALQRAAATQKPTDEEER
jgi:hypothetical protein